MNEENNKFFNFLDKTLMGPMSKIAQAKVVRGIMAAGIATIPFTIVGSMFLVLNILPTTFPFLQDIFNMTLGRVSELYMLANTATMGILALYFTIVLGYEYTKIFATEEGIELDPLNGALLSVFAFFMTLPVLLIEDGSMTTLTSVTEDSHVINGWIMGGDGAVRLGTSGIFVGIIIAILAVQLYRFSVKNNFTITMPEEVPTGVSRAFSTLIPAFLIAIVVIVLNGIFVAMGTDIFGVVAIPFGFVTEITDTWLGVTLIFFLINALWLVGIHGANIIISAIQPILFTNLAANAAGANIPLAGTYAKSFVELGGSGATLGLVVFMLYFARSAQLKTLGKAAIIPSLFNINEPVLFGTPIIYNPYLAVPFLAAPIVSTTISYFAIKWGFISPLVAQVPWPTPLGIGAFIGTGGDWKAGLLAVGIAVLTFFMYYPFAKAYDKKLLDEEMKISSSN